ncbi:MAG TPA: response regulator transcription factor, partial [Ktedonobacterales bacterium]|nr:response regulator transcription factor [Ktedonobacterales bacterium]
PTILVVDDEAGIVELMRDFLEVDGFTVLAARDGAAALAILAGEPVDCMLLDILMPGASGFEILRRIRETSDVPILFLTARDESSDKIRGLRLGADDYVVKSATPDEVVARVRAVLRRYRPDRLALGVAEEDMLDFGRLVIDVRAHEVRMDGTPVPMPAREFSLLLLFAKHPRQVFSRDRLFELAWGSFGDRSTVTTHIRRLREKIEENPAQPRYIVTVWGVGYRFEGVRK